MLCWLNSLGNDEKLFFSYLALKINNIDVIEWLKVFWNWHFLSALLASKAVLLKLDFSSKQVNKWSSPNFASNVLLSYSFVSKMQYLWKTGQVCKFPVSYKFCCAGSTHLEMMRNYFFLILPLKSIILMSLSDWKCFETDTFYQPCLHQRQSC